MQDFMLVSSNAQFLHCQALTPNTNTFSKGIKLFHCCGALYLNKLKIALLVT